MLIKKTIPSVLLGTLLISLFTRTGYSKPVFKGSEQAIPASIVQSMKKISWRTGCPVPLHELRYLRLSYWGYDNQVHSGEMIVHRRLAAEIVEIFTELFAVGFPIHSMRRIEHFQGSDDRSMDADNTSAFNCRPVLGRKNKFSNHSYGIAIDINPLRNPYVKNSFVAPPAGQGYRDRSRTVPGMIKKGGPVYQAFKKRNWIWGGDWKSLKDYQHFEKEIQ